MTDSLSIAVHAFASRILMSVLVEVMIELKLKIIIKLVNVQKWDD